MNVRRFGDDKRGVTAIEFAILLTPLSLFLMTGIEMAYQGYATSVLQGTVSEAGRSTSLDGADTAAVATYVKSRLTPFSDETNIAIEVAAFEGFGKIGAPEKITTDKNGNGQYDPAGPDCFTDDNRSKTYDTNTAGRAGKGDAEDVVRYKVTMKLNRLTPAAPLFFMPEDMPIERTTYVKNEPYDKVVAPPTECGLPKAT